MNSNEIKIQKLIDDNKLGLDNKIIRNMFEGPNINILKNVSKQLSKNNLESNFDVVFENSEKSGKNENVFIYKKNSIKVIPSLVSKNTAISIVCAAYFNEDNNRIVIASRLNTDLIKKSLPGFGGGPPTTEESTKDKDHIKWGYAKGLLKNNNYYKEYKLSDDELKLEFRNKMTEILKPSDLNWYQTKAQNSIVYREYIPDMQIVPDLNNIIIKFNVDFPIIFDKYNNILYYEKNIELSNIASNKPYDIYEKKYKTEKGEKAEALAESVAESVDAGGKDGQQKAFAPELAQRPAAAAAAAGVHKNQGEDAAVESITSASVGSVEAPASDDGTALNPDSTVPATVVANEAAAGVMQQQGEGGPAPPEQEAAAGVMQRAMRNRRARNLMQERAQERARELSEEAAAEEMAANEAFADLDNAAEGGCMSRAESGGGYKRKLKRKELNTMSLNELKQLHRNNGIKMNGNKTVNALINNYIKNYK